MCFSYVLSLKSQLYLKQQSLYILDTCQPLITSGLYNVSDGVVSYDGNCRIFLVESELFHRKAARRRR